MTAVTMPAWMDEGLCAQTDPELYFPETSNAHAAKRVCATCPVQLACLTYALDLDREGEPLHGVWGGTTALERRRLRGVRTCQDCDVVIPAGRGTSPRCDPHREQRRREQKNAYTQRQAIRPAQTTGDAA